MNRNQKTINEILQDKHCYVESIGRDDRQGLIDAVHDRGADTVLRLGLWHQ